MTTAGGFRVPFFIRQLGFAALTVALTACGLFQARPLPGYLTAVRTTQFLGDMGLPADEQNLSVYGRLDVDLFFSRPVDGASARQGIHITNDRTGAALPLSIRVIDAQVTTETNAGSMVRLEADAGYTLRIENVRDENGQVFGEAYERHLHTRRGQ